MGIALCILALFTSVALSRRRLGHGLGFVLAVGFIYGWLRANFLDGLTHFSFDAALAGLYVSVLPTLRDPPGRAGKRLKLWTALLLGWPVLVILLSPFLEAQHLYVQLAGLRNAVLFVPLILIGRSMTEEDLGLLTSWAEWCVIGASCFAVGELVLGLEPFFPMNAVTQTLYESNDIVGGFSRIPASFTSAHAYGGVMVGLLPLLLSRIEEARGRRWLPVSASALALLGVFACGARIPVVLLTFVVLGMLLRLRRRPAALVIIALTIAVVGYTVSRSERLRRFETLADTEMVEERVAGSVNMSFWDILAESPMGRGLGSAVGTSVPFFLADFARPPVGIENEYGRLLLEEGFIGLLLWVAFVLSVLGRSAVELKRSTMKVVGMWIFCAGSWATALIGAGLLASIPATMLVMLFMGKLASRTRLREHVRQPAWIAPRSATEEPRTA